MNNEEVQKAAAKYVENAYRDFSKIHKNRFTFLTPEIQNAMFFKHCLSPSMISILRHENQQSDIVTWLLAIIDAVNTKISVTG